MNWDIKGCSGKCIKCNKDFDNEEIFCCRLFLEETGPMREDYCMNCWNVRTDSPKGYSNWQGRYRSQPQEIEEEPVKEPIAKQLLKKWLHSTERLHQCFCYVLALLLLRNRTFSEKPKIMGSDGKERLVYEDKDTGETYILEDPCLTINELTQIEGQLQGMLKQELNK